MQNSLAYLPNTAVPCRSLKPIDRDAIAASIRKTHRVVSVEEGWPQHGVGSGACHAKSLFLCCLFACCIWQPRTILSICSLSLPRPSLRLQRLWPSRLRSALTTWTRRPSA